MEVSKPEINSRMTCLNITRNFEVEGYIRFLPPYAYINNHHQNKPQIGKIPENK